MSSSKKKEPTTTTLDKPTQSQAQSGLSDAVTKKAQTLPPAELFVPCSRTVRTHTVEETHLYRSDTTDHKSVTIDIIKDLYPATPTSPGKTVIATEISKTSGGEPVLPDVRALVTRIHKKSGKGSKQASDKTETVDTIKQPFHDVAPALPVKTETTQTVKHPSDIPKQPTLKTVITKSVQDHKKPKKSPATKVTVRLAKQTLDKTEQVPSTPVITKTIKQPDKKPKQPTAVLDTVKKPHLPTNRPSAVFLAQRAKFNALLRKRQERAERLRRKRRSEEKARELRAYLRHIRDKNLRRNLQGQKLRPRQLKRVRINRVKHDRKAVLLMWKASKTRLYRGLWRPVKRVTLRKPFGYYKKLRILRRVKHKNYLIFVNRQRYIGSARLTQRLNARLLATREITANNTQLKSALPLTAFFTFGRRGYHTRKPTNVLVSKQTSKDFSKKIDRSGIRWRAHKPVNLRRLNRLTAERLTYAGTKKYLYRVACVKAFVKRRAFLRKRLHRILHLRLRRVSYVRAKHGLRTAHSLAYKKRTGRKPYRNKKFFTRLRVIRKRILLKKSPRTKKVPRRGKRGRRKLRNRLKYFKAEPMKRWLFYQTQQYPRNLRKKQSAGSKVVRFYQLTNKKFSGIAAKSAAVFRATVTCSTAKARRHILRVSTSRIKLAFRGFRYLRLRRYERRLRTRRCTLARAIYRSWLRTRVYFKMRRRGQQRPRLTGQLFRKALRYARFLANDGTKLPLPKGQLRTGASTKVSARGKKTKLQYAKARRNSYYTFKRVRQLHLGVRQKQHRRTTKKLLRSVLVKAVVMKSGRAAFTAAKMARVLLSRGAVHGAIRATIVNHPRATWANKKSSFAPLLVPNKIYKKIYDRRRARAVIGRLRRLKVRLVPSLKRPATYSIGQLRPRLSKKAYWLSRTAGRCVYTKLYYARDWKRSEETLARIPGKSMVETRYATLKRRETSKFIKTLPRYTLNYRLLFRRWHTRRDRFGSPIPRIWPSRAEIKRRERMNYARFCRDLPPKKAPDPVFHELEVTAGFPSAIGYRRRRRALQAKFNSNRWWKPRAVLSPLYYSSGLTQLRKSPAYAIEKSCGRIQRLKSALGVVSRRKAYPEARVSNWKAYLPRRMVWGRNNWRFLDGPLFESQNNLFTWSLPKLSKIISSAEFDCKTVFWAKCSARLGAAATAELRTQFIRQSKYWLSQRSHERVLQERVLSTDAGFAIARLKARVMMSRRQLFRKNPNWWREEARRRLIALEATFTAVKSNEVVGSEGAGDTVYASISGTEESRRMLAVTLSSMVRAEKDSYFNDLLHSVEGSLAITDRSFTGPHHLWLNHSEGYAKKTREAKSSQYHGDERKNIVTITGAEKPRFPGAGRRKSSYDSALRAFYRKTSISRFRRVQPRRFRHIRPQMFFASYRRQPRHETTQLTRRQYRYAQELASVRYTAKSWRRVLNIQKLHSCRVVHSATRNVVAETTLNLKVTSKRRRASSPVELLVSSLRTTFRDSQVQPLNEQSGAVEQLLLSAVRTRLKSRVLKDLRANVSSRLLPIEQIRPPWQRAKRKRSARKVRLARRRVFDKPKKYDEPKTLFWASSAFAVTTPRDLVVKALSQSTNGEALLKLPAKLTRSKLLSTSWSVTRGPQRRRRFCPRRARRKNRFQRWKQKTAKKKVPRKAKRKTKASLRKRRRSATKTRRPLKRLVARSLLAKFAAAHSKFNYRLSQPVQVRSALAPIQFAKKNTQVVLSKKEKKRQLEGVRALKQEHYKETAQLSDMVTTMYPQLISLLAEKQFQSKQMTVVELRGAISSIYWGLRIYLHADSTGGRLAGRDVNAAKFKTLYNEIVRYTENRYFDSEGVDAMRYRLQPHKVCPRQSFRRGTLGWLRAFFPRYYSLYLEDPDSYRGLTLTAMETLRTHPSRKNPGQWRTTAVHGTMEQQFKRLTKLCGRQKSSRFENLLMTTRRFPVIAGRGAASSMLVSKLPGLQAPNPSFFKRTYATKAFLHTANSKVIVALRAALQRRSGSSENTPLANRAAAYARYVLKSRTYARGRSKQAMARAEVGAGTIDPRLTRAKSPRNLQFNLRLKKTAVFSETSRYKQSIERLFEKRALEDKSGKNLYRRSNRAVTATAVSAVANRPTVVGSTRCNVKQRRAASALFARASAVLQAHRAKSQRRLFTEKRKALRFTNRTRTPWAKSGIIKSSRSILHAHQAAHRTKQTALATNFTLARKSIFLKPANTGLLLANEAKIPFLKKVYRARFRFANWFGKKKLRSYLKVLAGTTVKRTKLSAAPLRIGVGRGLRRWPHPHVLPIYSSRRGGLLSKKNKKTTYRTRRHFYSRLVISRKNHRIISRFLIAKRDFALENPGTLGRKELWRNVTARWMKKHRVLKNWLKFANLGLKDIDWYFMPPVIFKGVRSRLRKLEWREPDRHFNRRGWRNAFRFFPNEQRKAPWLEKLMYRRSLYSTIRGAYRRYQFPREQKRLKWLQYYRRAILPRRNRTYLKSRRWPRLRIYNQRLFRSLFSLRNKRTAQRHFQRLAKRKPVTTGFSTALKGLGNRLDVSLVLLNMAPTIFWAKVMAPYGIFRINNKVTRDPAFRLQANDRIHWNWNAINRINAHFQPALRKYDKPKLQNSTTQFPKNFEYYPGIATAIYKGLPNPEDLPEGSRLQPFLFRMFRAEAISGK